MPSHAKNIIYYWIPLLALCGFYGYCALGFEPHDFANYYFGAKFMAEGRFDDWIYLPYEFNHAIAAAGHASIFASYAPNTPFLALAFVPLSFFSLAVAKTIFNAVSIALFCLTLSRFVNYYRIDARYLLLVPILFWIPIKNGLLFSQVYLLLFFLIGESWLAYKRKNTLRAALMLGLAICLKIFPALLLLVWGFRKKYWLIAAVLAVCVVLVLASVFVSSTEVWLFFVQKVLPKASAGEIATAYVVNYQSVWMFLKYGLVYDAVENPTPVWHQPFAFALLMAAFKTVVIAIGYYVSRKVNAPLFALSYWILAMLLLSPYGSTYGLVLLVFPFLALTKTRKVPFRIAGMALIFIVCNVPVAWFAKAVWPISHVRLLAFLLLLALFIALVYKRIRMGTVGWITIGVTAIAGLYAMTTPQNPIPTKPIIPNAPILIYDYSLDQNQLTYHYWDGSGANKKSTAFAASKWQPLPLHDNRIFIDNEPLSLAPGTLRKPMLVDGRTLIFLSDESRGIGFYTLRQLELK